jgi:hypothetical protein
MAFEISSSNQIQNISVTYLSILEILVSILLNLLQSLEI